MILPNVSSLEIHTMNRGSPNLECIALRALTDVDMGRYALLIGYRAENGLTFPYRDNLFWFGDGLVRQNDWIFIYTCGGQSRQTTGTGGVKLYSVFWGKAETVFADSRVVPVLIEIGAISLGIPPQNLPQAKLISQS